MSKIQNIASFLYRKGFTHYMNLPIGYEKFTSDGRWVTKTIKEAGFTVTANVAFTEWEMVMWISVDKNKYENIAEEKSDKLHVAYKQMEGALEDIDELVELAVEDFVTQNSEMTLKPVDDVPKGWLESYEKFGNPHLQPVRA